MSDSSAHPVERASHLSFGAAAGSARPGSHDFEPDLRSARHFTAHSRSGLSPCVTTMKRIASRFVSRLRQVKEHANQLSHVVSRLAT
jgi:hypothetical protein